MKKLLLTLAAMLAAGTLVCHAQAATTVKVGASPTPHAEILNAAKDMLKAEGINLEIIEYSDYVQPNVALDSKDLDANYFQHKPYLDDFNAQKGTKLSSMGGVHYEPFGIYAGKCKSLKDLKKGAIVAVPNDATNEGRALLLMQDQGLITLKDGVGLTATVRDIKDNPKKLRIEEIEAAQLVRALPDVDIAIINGNYAILGGIAVLWLVLLVYYWLLVMAWLYKNALSEGMNQSLWPILGLFTNLLAVLAFLIVRDDPRRRKAAA